MSPMHGFIGYLVSGVNLLVAGFWFAVYSIRQISGVYIKHQIYFFWSFNTVQPTSNIPVGPITPPPLVVTSEILLPWLLIGLTSILFGIYLLTRIRRYTINVSISVRS